MFGPGLNGFKGYIPPLPPPTQVTPEWHNSVQMEIVNVILGQGIPLDGLQFDQMKKALDDYAFVDPHITGSLKIDGGAVLTIDNLALLDVLAGGASVYRNGSTLAFEANVTLIASNNTWVWGTSNANDWTINGNVTLGTDATNMLTVNSEATFNEDVTISTATLIVPTIEQTDNSGIIRTGEIRFYADTNPLFSSGALQFDGRSLRLGNAVSADVIPVPEDDFVAGDINTVNAIDDTGASVTLSLLIGERCIVQMSSEMANTNVGSTIAIRIEANGVTQGGTATRYEASANAFMDAGRSIEYTAIANGAVQFKARYGAVAGTTTARNIHITARRSD